MLLPVQVLINFRGDKDYVKDVDLSLQLYKDYVRDVDLSLQLYKDYVSDVVYITDIDFNTV